jgi:DNA-binding beta-propeller fold protein YncE
VTTRLRGARVAGAALVVLCLAWCCASCSPAAGRVASSAGVSSARPSTAVATSPETTSGQQVWASSLRGACCLVGVVSPEGTTVFVSGFVEAFRDRRLVSNHFETVAYRAATGARLWASSYQPGGWSRPVAITVSPDGARVYVTADGIGRGQGGIVAYDARTGRQLWASRYMPNGLAAGVSGLAVSPDGTTLYLTGRTGSAQSQFAVIAYAAATGKQRWLRYSTGKRGDAESVAVSPDGKTVYATGSAGSSALTVAYGAAGTLKWAARYKDPYGFAAGSQIVAGPGGGAVYVAGKAANKNGHFDVATFAYRAATGRRMWLDRHYALITAGLLPAPEIAVTPGGQTVIVTVPLHGDRSLPFAIASYNASTGRTRWTRLAPDSSGWWVQSGLVISPRGDTMFIGGNRTAAYSVADGAVQWTTSYSRSFPLGGLVSGIIGLSGDGTRLFGTRQKTGPRWGITIVAYKT